MQKASPIKVLQHRLVTREESSGPIGLFRILFGFLVAGELAWYSFATPFMEVFYYDPTYHFSYPGIPHLPFVNGVGMQVFVAALALCFLLLALGWGYRVLKWLCCIGFAYLFFLERAAYLNHWYLTLLICVLLLWIPANRRFSLDVKLGWAERQATFPAWTRGLLLALTGIVYLMSGLNKLEWDWVSGRTMDLVVQSVSGPIEHAPIIDGVDILAAWGILAMEILAWPLLMLRFTRKIFVFPLLAFHVANLWMFTIGFFPFVMILLTLLFVPEWWPGGRKVVPQPDLRPSPRPALRGLLLLFFALQVFLPLRHHLYPGNTLWTEEGRLFSWDMFLAFKGGSVEYILQDNRDGSRQTLLPTEAGLTWGQANKIFKNPDMILQFAHYLVAKTQKQGPNSMKIFVRSECSLNGRPAQWLIHPNQDLGAREATFWRSNSWVMPLLDEPMPSRR